MRRTQSLISYKYIINILRVNPDALTSQAGRKRCRLTVASAANRIRKAVRHTRRRLEPSIQPDSVEIIRKMIRKDHRTTGGVSESQRG